MKTFPIDRLVGMLSRDFPPIHDGNGLSMLKGATQLISGAATYLEGKSELSSFQGKCLVKPYRFVPHHSTYQNA